MEFDTGKETIAIRDITFGELLDFYAEQKELTEGKEFTVLDDMKLKLKYLGLLSNDKITFDLCRSLTKNKAKDLFELWNQIISLNESDVTKK